MQACGMARAAAGRAAASAVRLSRRSNGAPRCPAAVRSHTRAAHRAVGGHVPSAELQGARKLAGVARASTDSSEAVQNASVDELSVPKGTTWELDFCSRPLVDDKGKKVSARVPRPLEPFLHK